jgi:hypothetical protein
MKVRWTNRSIRLRITPSELEALKAGHSISESSDFPGGWNVTIERREVPGLCSGVKGGELIFALDSASVDCLAQPDREGVYFSDGSLRYYIEKDFPCLHPRPAEVSESPTETFEAPGDFARRKLG